MFIATDGACKRNGQETCTSTGVAWILPDNGEMLFKAQYESHSTSQRGELNGIICALEYAVDNLEPEESLIILTDSEYMFNTISKDWCHKWARQRWTGSTGPVKNPDMWQHVVDLLDTPQLTDNVFMQWTKGHMVHYTPGKTKNAMQRDPSGVELYMRIMSIAQRPGDAKRIIDDFNWNRTQHGFDAVPNEVAIQWAVCNEVADCLAAYIEGLYDAQVF